jgi:uncharacterized protein (TIGR00299 family) protein
VNTEKNKRKIIFLNAAAGISGDMLLGALTDIASTLDDGFDLGELVKNIKLDGCSVSVRRDKRAGISGLKIDVHSHEHHPHRGLSDILKILESGDLPRKALDKTISAFTLLAEAEAKVHGVTPEEIHFHEVGAVDAIVDITGAMLLMDRLGWPEVISSPVNVGSGTVKCAHGVLPIPGPAAAELLRGMKIFSSGEPMERTTPTGALLLRVLAGRDGFRDLPPGRVICSGVGLGSRDTQDIPNALSAILIEAETGESGKFMRDAPSMVEANIDDMNPQDFAPVVEELLVRGAMDVWCENILMKKGRPAVKFCCLCKLEDAERFGEHIIRHTTTLGVRITNTSRIFLERSTGETDTSLGKAMVKSAFLGKEEIRRTPEFDDLLRISREKNIPLPELRKIIGREI